jgi:hypothetical protein
MVRVMQVPSRLSWMLSGRWDADLPIDRDGRIFLDFDPAWFDPIINHLVLPTDKLCYKESAALLS